MKNYIYKTIGLLAVFLVTLNTIAQVQDRNVVWVHGLRGDASSWEHYDNLFKEERKMNTLRGWHTSTLGINVAANSVKAHMIGFYGSTEATNPRNIGIGHSMGGLMLREVDRMVTGNKKFGGLITVATPNYGAPIVNSIIDGSVNSAKDNALDKLSAGPFAEFLGIHWEIVSGVTVQKISDWFINDKINDYEDDSFDLRVGSPTIDSINSYPTTIPQISIWAEENSPVHWRLASSSKGWSDHNLVNYVNNARFAYNAHYASNLSIAISHFWNPFVAAIFYHKASEWKKGRDWIDDSETIYSSLIKTTRTEPETYWQEVWVPCPYPPNYPPLPEANNTASKNVDPDCGEWLWQEFTRYVTVNYPSDGLLPQYTQELQNIPAGNRYKVSGANHVEVRDMSEGTVDETADQFILIFDRDIGDFFRTDKRIP